MGMAVTHNRLYDNAAAVQHRQDMRRIARCSFHAICRVSAACRLASSQSDAPCAAMQGKPATSAVVTLSGDLSIDLASLPTDWRGLQGQ